MKQRKQHSTDPTERRSTVISGKVYREAQFVPETVNKDERSVVVCWTTGARGLRAPWFDDPYYEELSVKDGHVRLERLNNGAPLLDTHKKSTLDDQIGVSERAWIEDGKGFAKVRFRSNDRSLSIFKDVSEGTIRNVSIGYAVHEAVERKDEGDDYITRKAVDWEPMEISFVPVNFDAQAQARSDSEQVQTRVLRLVSPSQADDINLESEERSMSLVAKKVPVAQPASGEGQAEQRIDVGNNRSQIIEMIEMGERFGRQDVAKRFIEDGRSADDLRREIMSGMVNAQDQGQTQTSEPIGMSEREARSFSLVRAIRAAATNDWRGAEFERDVSEATRKKFGREGSGNILIPTDVLRSSSEFMTRRLNVAPNSGGDLSGGAFVENELRSDAFIVLLRNRLVIRRLGAKILDGLRGDITIPKQTGGATAHWVAEGIAPAESTQTTTQIALKPKTVGAWTDISRKLLLQSSISVEQFVRDDISASIARKIDHSVVYGSGRDSQPLGVTLLTGIGTIPSAAPAKITYENLVKLEGLVQSANADHGTMAYLTNSRVKSQLKTILKAAGVSGYLWEGNLPDGDGIVNGYRCAISNMIPVTANAAPVIFGNWSDVIIGEWGVLDVLVNPYGPGSDAGTVRIRALQDVDVAVRYAEAFAWIQNVLVPE